MSVWRECDGIPVYGINILFFYTRSSKNIKTEFVFLCETMFRTIHIICTYAYVRSYHSITSDPVEFFNKRCLKINKSKRVGTHPLVPNPYGKTRCRDPFRRFTGSKWIIFFPWNNSTCSHRCFKVSTTKRLNRSVR